MFKKTLLAGLCLAVLPLAAQADNNPPQLITITAARIPTPAQKTPAGVTVITRAQMQARGDVTLVDALAAVPGLGVVQSGGPGNTASVFIRGADSEDVLVLLDGVPVNDPSEANGAFNFGDITLQDVQRIEIIRGPMSGLYGANAIGGVINIITLQGAGRPQASITLAGGFPGQFQGGLTLSGSTGAWDYALSGEDNAQAGFDATARRLSVYAGHRDPYRAQLGALNLGYTLVPGTRVSLVLRAQHTDAAFPDLGYPIFDDPDAHDDNNDLFGKFGLTSLLDNGFWETSLFIARLADELHYQNLLDADDPNAAEAGDFYHGTRTDAQWNNVLHPADAGPSRDASATFGLEVADDGARENVNENDGGSPFIETVRAAQHTLAGHAGAQTTLFGRLTLTGALRDDAVSSFGNAFTWRAGAVLAVPEADAHLKFAYGTGFLAPSLFDLYYVDSYGDNGNPDLRPEYSSGFEAGPQFDVPLLGQADFASLSASYFQSSIRDLIQAVATPSYTYTEENIGRANIRGVETEAVLTPANWLRADVSYTYTKAEDAATGTPLLRRPRNTGSATITLTPLPGLSIVPQVQVTGRFEDYLYADDGLPTGTGSADAGTLVNLSVNYRLEDGITVFATGRNILNSNFEPVNGLQTPGASLLLGVRATVE